MPDIIANPVAAQKATLRKRLRAMRRQHAAALPQEVLALVFCRPPRAVLELIPAGAIIGLYHADAGEAPAARYGQFLFEAGHTLALPRITTLDQPMQFHLHSDPFGFSDLEEGPKGLRQPAADAPQLAPHVLFMPLVGFTAEGDRLGQGGGFYDRWLATHPDTIALGLAWDEQLVDQADMPVEPHDMKITAIITPTRLYGPF